MQGELAVLSESVEVLYCGLPDTKLSIAANNTRNGFAAVRRWYSLSPLFLGL